MTQGPKPRGLSRKGGGSVQGGSTPCEIRLKALKGGAVRGAVNQSGTHKAAGPAEQGT